MKIMAVNIPYLIFKNGFICAESSVHWVLLQEESIFHMNSGCFMKPILMIQNHAYIHCCVYNETSISRRELLNCFKTRQIYLFNILRFTESFKSSTSSPIL